ncbi:MAG: sigma-70 family RNA polymerase sigma factor [Acidobacteriota bacterium]
MIQDDARTDDRAEAAEQRAEDIALIRRIADGDQHALALLYDRFSTMLLALARRVLHDDSEAEEILQEAFLQVWRQAGRYDDRRSSVATWLVLITRSRAIDRLRTRQVIGRTLDNLQQETRTAHTSPEGIRSVLDEQRRKRLLGALADLPPEQRQVLELAFYSGMTQSEIAADTGIPLGTVKTRTLLAMKKLRKALESELRELL